MRVIYNDGDFAVATDDAGELTLIKRSRRYAVQEICPADKFLVGHRVEGPVDPVAFKDAMWLVQSYVKTLDRERDLFSGEARRSPGFDWNEVARQHGQPA